MLPGCHPPPGHWTKTRSNRMFITEIGSGGVGRGGEEGNQTGISSGCGCCDIIIYHPIIHLYHFMMGMIFWRSFRHLFQALFFVHQPIREEEESEAGDRRVRPSETDSCLSLAGRGGEWAEGAGGEAGSTETCRCRYGYILVVFRI